ncbi:MAG: CPBP family intramembrane metalloprotease [Acidobacteriota bacterium]
MAYSSYRPSTLRTLPWLFIAIASPLSDITAHFLTGAVPSSLWILQIAALALAALSPPFRPFSIIYAFEKILFNLHSVFAGPTSEIAGGANFIADEIQAFSIGIVFSALIVSLAAYLCGGLRAVYFRPGNLRAPVELHGLRRLRWDIAAPVLGIGSFGFALAYVVLTGDPVEHSLSMVLWAVPFAVTNAFLEECTYRIAFIPALIPHFGPRTAIFVSAAIFGLGHWNGLPYGLPGVLLTLALGLIVSKALVDTRGLFWPWFIHFCPDLVMFYFWGLGGVIHK